VPGIGHAPTSVEPPVLEALERLLWGGSSG
jgi:hypothetical protein